MPTSRLEAFSDGVLAIIITVMVLELRTPEGSDWAALCALGPVIATYLMSFVYIGIYWNNHHHLMHVTEQINGWVLWANLHLLFWLSLIPFVTGWMGRSDFAALPTATYGAVLLLGALAWLMLQSALLREPEVNTKLRAAIGSDAKGKTSFLIYAIAIGLAFVESWLAIALYILVALIWLAPDRRLAAQHQGR